MTKKDARVQILSSKKEVSAAGVSLCGENDMKQQKIISAAAVLNTLADIPTPGPDAQRITALVRWRGRVTGYQLADGQILTKDEGVSLARRCGILGVGVGVRKGEEYLKALPDGSEGNNLSCLPSIPPSGGAFRVTP